MNILKKFYFFFLILFIFPACSDLETIEVKDDNGNIIEVYSRNKENFAKQGLYKAFSENGKLLEEAMYVNDTLNGERKLYFENESIQAIELYENGNFEGKFKGFYEDGNLELEGNYVNNEMTGVWKRFYKDGKLMEEVNFKNNEENGVFVEYFQNGKIKTEGSYLEGDNEHGELKIYSKNGEIERIMDCEKGRCKTRWVKEGMESTK